jgi:hypothetical protein
MLTRTVNRGSTKFRPALYFQQICEASASSKAPLSKTPRRKTPFSEAAASIKMPLSEVPLCLVPRSEAPASSGVPLSETPTPRGTILLSCLVQGNRVFGRNKQSVHGRASIRQRQRSFGQQRVAAQQDNEAARDDFFHRKRITNVS